MRARDTAVITLAACLFGFHPTDSQTQHLSSYQLTVPRPVGGRFRREVDGNLPSQVLDRPL